MELCSCGHANDHVGKRCRHPAGDSMCPCAAGIRTDLALLQAVDGIGAILVQLNGMTARLLAVVEQASGLESRMVSSDGGHSARAEVRRKQQQLVTVLR